jgi:hypothetical protein
MTVNANDTIERYTVSGVGPYPFSFRIFADTDLQVTACSAATPPVPNLLVYLTHYTITGANVQSGGTITLTAAAATTYAGYTLDIRSNTPETQPTSIRNIGRFLPEVHEDAFDHLERQTQDINRRLLASIHLPDNEILSGEVESAAVRKGRYLFWDAVTGAITSVISLTGTALSQAIFNTFYFLTDDHKRTAAEIAAGVTPVNYAYAPGYLLRYGLVTLGAGVSGAARTANLAALNAATRVCAYGKDILQLPAGTLEINGTWDCTASSGASTTTNGGIWIRGCGKVNSIIQYIGGANNVGKAWDQTGLAFGRFEAFAFIGGASTSDCPKVTLLQGALNSGGFVFSGNSNWFDVTLQGYGDHVWYNAGCEAQNFLDCSLYAWRDQSFVNAQPVVFVASGSTPTQTSALVTTYTPINSMTLIRWSGAKAAMLFYGSVGINFHFTAATTGACADIRIDDWMQVLTASGPFRFMQDDSGGAAGTALFRIGSERLIIEAATSNQDIRVGAFDVPLAEGLKFEGRLAAGHTITARPFQFGASSVPTNCQFDWHPNVSSTWTGDYIVQCAGTENGVHVRAPVAVANLINVTSSRTINSFPGFGYSAAGTDYAAVLGTVLNVGASANAQFNRTNVIRAGAFVSGNSDGSIGVQTTQTVAAVATVILNVPGLASLVIVAGTDAGGNRFTDLVMAGFSGTPSVILTRTESGGPAARTYTAVAGTLKLAMAAGTYNIQCTVFGGGIQA